MINKPPIRRFTAYSIIIGYLAIVYFVQLKGNFNETSTFYDFGSFLAAGQLSIEGQDPYSIDSPYVFSIVFGNGEVGGVAPNLNPPISVVFFRSLAKYDPIIAISIWRVITGLLFIVSAYILHQAYPIKGIWAGLRFAWVLSMAGIWHTFQLGQVYGLMLILTALVWILSHNGRFVAAGIILGLLIGIKPNFVLWALLLLVGGNWRLFLSAGFSALSISAIPVLTDGIQIYGQWLNAASLYTPDLLLFPGNNSFQGLAARFQVSWLGVAASVILVIFLLAYIRKNHLDQEKINAIGIVSSLLVSPIAWTGYTLLTIPIFFEKTNWPWWFWASAAIFTVPFIFPLVLFTTSFVNFILFGWFYGWGLLCLIFGLLAEKKNQTQLAT